MRYGIFSDVHSNLEALTQVLGQYKGEGLDCLLCAGDIVGYGANPNECLEKVRASVSSVCAGNHDWASVNLFSLDYFNSDAAYAVLWTRLILNDSEKGFLASLKLVFRNPDLAIVHGSLDNPEEFKYINNVYAAEETFRLMQDRICFIGHSHVPAVFRKDRDENIYYHKESTVYLNDSDKYIVNVGSVGQPRDGDSRACYCIYDTEKKLVQIRRIEYDAGQARKKIIYKGLPEALGDRLLTGR